MKEIKEAIVKAIENVDVNELLNKLGEKLDGEQLVKIVGAGLIAVVTMRK